MTRSYVVGKVSSVCHREPIATRPTLPAPPEADDLLCPRCSTPSHPVVMRTRGEVRSRVWQCGCVIAPEVRVEPFGVLGERLHVARGHAIEELHPTEAGAIAAWRVALEQRQREDDERSAHPMIAVYHDADHVPLRWEAIHGGTGETPTPSQPWQRGALRSVLRAAAVRQLHGRFAEQAAEWIGTPAVARGIGGAHVAFARFDYSTGVRLLAEAGAYGAVEAARTGSGAIDHEAHEKAVAARIAEQYLARERECIATLPDRTDDEVRDVAAACTGATHVETLVAVANECARRWPERAGAVERFEIVRGEPVLVFRDGRREDTTARLVIASARLYARAS